MTTYANLGGNSGVAAYEIGAGSIKVEEFNDGSVYLYTNASAGYANIQEMHRLARAGQGLSAYIKTTVKKWYASKLR